MPPPEIRRLRDLTRYRVDLVNACTAEKNRAEKLLEDACIKLSSVASELFSVSGRDLGNPTTVRVELTRLRRTVGDLLASRPYRLTRPVRADVNDVTAAVRRGDLAGALTAYRGPLLPSSEAPGVTAQRRWLGTQLRSAVLGCADPDTVRGWADRSGFSDLQVWERLAALSAGRSPHRAVAAARIRQLRTE